MANCSFSLRDENLEVFHIILNQHGKRCALCAVVNTCSTGVARKYRIKIAFSGETLHADLARRNNLPRRGGMYLEDVLKCAQEEGLTIEKGKSKRMFIRFFQKMQKDVTLIEQLLKDPRNSLVASLNVYQHFDDCESDEVYDPQRFKSNGRELDYIGHAMSISGIRKQRKQLDGVGKKRDFWFLECLNSYGSKFCDEGFIKVMIDLFCEIFVITDIDFLFVEKEMTSEKLKALKIQKPLCELSRAVAFLESALFTIGKTPK